MAADGPQRGIGGPSWLRLARLAWALGALALLGGAVAPSVAALAGTIGLGLAALCVASACASHGIGTNSPWATLSGVIILHGVGLATRGLPVASTVASVLSLLLVLESLRRLRRSQGIDRGSLMDAATVSCAVAAIMSEVLWAPLVHGGLTAAETRVVIDNLAGMVVLSLLAYLLLTNVSLRLHSSRRVVVGLLLSVGAQLPWELLLAAVPAMGPGHSTSWVGPRSATVLLAAGLTMAAGALHPTMTQLGQQSGGGKLTERRLALLGLCGVVPLVLLVLQVRFEPGVWPLAICGAVLVSLLVARLGTVLSGRDDDHRRDTALKAGLTALVVATDNSTIELAVVLAARNLLEDRGATIRLLDIDGALGTSVAVFGPANRGAAPDAVIAAMRPEQERPWLLCVVVPSSKGPNALLAAALARNPSPALLEAFQTLAGQLGLARERAAMAEAMHRRHAERRLAALVQNAFDVITILDHSLTMRFQSPSVTAVLGYQPEEVLHGDFRTLLHPDDTANVEAQLEHLASGSARSGTRIDCRLRNSREEWLEVEIIATNLLSDPDVSGLVLNIRNVSERKTLEQQLIRQAFHDPLTGLANRVLLADRVSHALAATARGGTQPAVLFIDLDDFKMINDSLGHPAGDRLLVEISERLVTCLRPGDTAARMGGDEFAVLLEKAGSLNTEAMTEVASRVLEAICVPLVLEGTEITPRASVGVASGSDASNANDLLRNADLAMYIAKAQGGGLSLFEPSMHDSARRRLELQAELTRALDRQEFELHYQPIVTLAVDGVGADPAALIARPRVMGVEALVRWNHPQRGMVAPAEFIPLAEETGLIVALGRWVMEEACRTVAGWAERGLMSGLSLTVNVSARQLQETSLVNDVSLAIAASGIDPSWLVIEITESVVMHDTAASVGWLHALKQLGVRIAIDDFGTGYSSLAYLQTFPIDVMKIDRSFVTGLGSDPKAAELVRAVLNLSDSLGMVTLAEGIETIEQLIELQRLGCQLGQGYVFARPMSASAMIASVGSGSLLMAKPGPAVAVSELVSPPRG